MKFNLKRLTMVIVLLIITISLGNGSYAYFFSDGPSLPNYYQPNLVLELRCNGDTQDYSGCLNHGVLAGQDTPPYVTSINDRGLNFNGTNFVEINDSPSLNLGTGNFSMAVWFKTTSNLNNVIIDKRNPLYNYQGYCLTLYCGAPLLQLGDGGPYLSFWPGYGAPVYNDGQWHYLGVTASRDGSSFVTVDMYVDGVRIYHGTSPRPVASISNNTKLYIGKNFDGSGNFNGSLDDVSIFNVSLAGLCSRSQTEELQICRYNLYTSTALDATLDNSISDSSRYQNTATFYGGTPLYVPSMNGTGISLNYSQSQYIKVNNNPSLNFGTGDFTMACWYKTNSAMTNNILFDKRSSVYQGFCLTLYRGVPLFQMGDESGYSNFWLGVSGPAYNNNQWHFIMISVDRDSATGVKMYVDGNLIYTGDPTIRSSSVSSTADFYIGKNRDGSYYQGSIDEVYLFNRALPGNLTDEYNLPNLLSAEPGDSRVTLLWKTVPGATGYNIKRSTASGGPFSNIATGLTGTTFTDTGVTNGTTYYYEITALFIAGESNPSPIKAATPRGATYPWTMMAKLPVRSFNLKAVTVDGKIYILGCNEAQDADFKVYEYNSSANSWTEKTTLSINRTNVGVAAYNGKIYIMGGADKTTGQSVSTVQEYNPASGSLVTKSSMLTVRYNPAVAVANNKIYACGGSNNGVQLRVTEEYDPNDTTNGYDINGNPMGRWVSKALFSTVGDAFSAAAANGKIYLLGGSNNGVPSNAVEEFDPNANSWTFKASLPTARGFLGAVTVGNRIYAIGGRDNNNSTITNIVEEYDPTANLWVTKPTIIDARAYFGATELDGSIYIIGGMGGLVCFESILNSMEKYTPTPLTAISNTSQITLTWYTVGGAQSYTVKRANEPGGTYSVIASNLTETTFTDTGLIMSHPYYYMVYAIRNGVEVAVTNEAWALLGLMAPTNFTVVWDTDHFHFSWDGVSKATGYYFKYSTTPGGPYTHAGAQTYTYADYDPNGTRYVVVSAINADGESPNSVELMVVP